MRLLLVEDDLLLGDGISAGLKQDGYTVDWVQDGESADHALQSEHFDIVVLDINLPRLSGIGVLKRLRDRRNVIPVLLLTARDTITDRVQGLDCGADDYLTKPFDLNELNARLRALLRRSSGRATPLLVNGLIVLDPAARRVTLDGQEIELSQREFVLLQAFLDNLGRVLSRTRLEQMLYGWGVEVESNTLEVHIHHLRKKLTTTLIRTVRGVGYVMEKSDA
ncbi:MAG: response regulator transcription factor [Pseudomonadota bacterium]|nr:response regulator transcription factor [Pseudomonadota bacterium]